jgi:hypothetical protein
MGLSVYRAKQRKVACKRDASLSVVRGKYFFSKKKKKACKIENNALYLLLDCKMFFCRQAVGFYCF